MIPLNRPNLSIHFLLIMWTAVKSSSYAANLNTETHGTADDFLLVPAGVCHGHSS